MHDSIMIQDIVNTVIDKLKPEALSLKEALTILISAEEKAQSMQTSMSITVVDQGGHLIAEHRMDHAILASISLSFSKAYTSVFLQSATEELAKSVLPGQPLYGLTEAQPNHLCIIGGGVPILRSGICIGGLGISGGTVEEDITVAEYAVKKHSDKKSDKSDYVTCGDA